MEYIYAALILHKLKKEINESNITSIIKAAGTEVNDAKVKSLITSLEDIEIDKILESSSSNLIQDTATSQSSTTSQQTEKKEQTTKDKSEKNEKTEEQAMEGLASLFG